MILGLAMEIKKDGNDPHLFTFYVFFLEKLKENVRKIKEKKWKKKPLMFYQIYLTYISNFFFSKRFL